MQGFDRTGFSVCQWGALRAICMTALLIVSVVLKAQSPTDRVISEAGALVKKGRAAEARSSLEATIHQLETHRDTLRLLRALALLGRAEYDLGELPAALRHLQRTIDLGSITGANSELGKACALKAIIASETSHPDSARHLYERAIHYYLLAHDTAACAIVYDNLGEFNLIAGDIPGAITWSEKALACLTDTTWPDYYRTAAIVESSLSNYHTWLGDRKKGIEHGVRSVQLARRSGEVYTIVHTGTQLAGAYLANGEVKKALPLLLRSDSLANTHTIPVNKHRDIPELLSSAYEMLGDHAKALYYYKQRAALNDSVRSKITRREMERLERRQIHIADSLQHAGELREQTLVHEQQSAAQRRTVYLVLAGCAVLLLIALIVWDRYRRLRAAHRTIISTQHQLLESERAREAEAVRARIARDIHDEIGSELTKITLLGALAQQRLAASLGEATETVERIRGLSKGLGNTLSDVVWAVDPQHDSVQALVDHARDFCQRMLEGTNTTAVLHFELSGPDRPIDTSTKRDIFLVLKEALNNALKHAAARTIEVRLETTAEGYDLLVKDDGRGFEPTGRGNGLGNMRSRAGSLGATITVTASPGSGTRVELRGTFS